MNKPNLPSETPAKSGDSDAPAPAAKDVTKQSDTWIRDQYLNPPLDEYWAQQVAENARSKVLSYFATATVLIAAVSFLYGKDIIDRTVEQEVKAAVSARSSAIDQQIDKLMAPERKKVSKLETQVNELNASIATYSKRTKNQYDSFEQLLGSMDDVSKVRALLRNEHAPIAPVALSTFDLSTKIGQIIDSGASNTGEAAPALYAIEAMISKADQRVPLSIAGAFYGAGGSDFGVTAVDLLNSLKGVGAFRLSDWPLQDKAKPEGAKPVLRIVGWQSAKKADLATVLTHLREGRVVITEMTLDDSFTSYRGGIFRNPKKSDFGLHLMAIVGYDKATDSLKLANSWGVAWGEGGFMRIGTSAFLARAGTLYWLTGITEV